MCRGVRKVLLFGLPMLLCWLVSGDPALSQTSTGGSGDLMQMFQSLSPEQQDAIMKQLGVSGGAGGILGLLGGGSASQGSQGAQGRRGQSTGNRAENEEGGEEEANLPEPTGLNGDDWVIVLANLPGNSTPAPAPSTAAAAPAAPPLPGPGAGASRPTRLRTRRLRHRLQA